MVDNPEMRCMALMTEANRQTSFFLLELLFSECYRAETLALIGVKVTIFANPT